MQQHVARHAVRGCARRAAAAHGSALSALPLALPLPLPVPLPVPVPAQPRFQPSLPARGFHSRAWALSEDKNSSSDASSTSTAAPAPPADADTEAKAGGGGSGSGAAATPPPPPHAANGAHGHTAARDMKPSELVAELDRFIIGQADAKRAVSIALRNRWRRHRLPPHMRRDVTPKNLLLIGPTGCGKTEIARRLARLTSSPFVKVEATKFTEVGYHGRDVDSIIADLVRAAIAQTKASRKARAKEEVRARVADRLLEALAGEGSKESFREPLESGQLEDVEVEVELPVLGPEGDDADYNERAGLSAQRLASLFNMAVSSAGGRGTEKRRLRIREARGLLEEAELDKEAAGEDVVSEALRSAQEDGIVFIDEIDKIASPAHAHKGPDASSEGVQRDLLPLLEGTTVSTKHGDVNTDHILFICSGAFHAVKPADLLAELQGRLPIRVELTALTEDDLYRVLAHTQHSLVKQQTALLKVDKCNLTWTDEALREIAKVSADMNRSIENIGARRLNTVLEKIVDDVSFEAADTDEEMNVVVDVDMVRRKVEEINKATDLGKFIL